MVLGFEIKPAAYYDADAIIAGLGLSETALNRARRSNELRSTRRGGRFLYRGQWLIDWIEAAANETVVDGEVTT